VHVDMTVRKDPEFPMFPRFGLRLFLDGAFDQVTYYGRGPHESYPDKHRASSHGRYSSSVPELHVDYLRPQENGSHHDCDYVIAHDDAARAIAAVGDQTFSFNASPYTQEQLADARRNVDLTGSGETVWCLDYAHNGIGSNSCGPELLEKYRLDAPEFRFALTLVPSASVESTIPHHRNEANA
ncbi:MAG: beta-galactosidase small subunit, partial [Candidatus Nanopelagicales bacterium]